MSNTAEITDAIEHDALVPDAQVSRELSITPMTLWRWDRDAALIEAGWPPPIRIRKRKFRSRRALEWFKRTMARRAIAQRDSDDEVGRAPWRARSRRRA